MVRWKKEKVSRVSRWSLSHNEALGEAGGGRSEEEGARFWPMLTTPTSASLTNRKRARLDGKVVDDCDAVDPSPVPRKLRSAINKCSSQSSSPAIPGAKKKPYDTFNGLQVLHGNGGRRCKQNVLLGSLTEDEKEVLEALCALSRILPIKERIQDDKDREISENHQDNIATPTTHSEGLSIAPDSGSHITPLSENVHPENIPGNLQSFLSPSGVLPRHCTENRTLQPTQCGSIIAFPPCKSEMLQPNGCVGSAALKHEVQYLKHNSESSTKLVYQKGNVPPHIQLSSSNSAVWPGPATSITSKEVNLPTMKVPLDVTPLWKKCAVHVFISHMIKSYQEKEQQHTLILPSEDSKSRVGSESCELVNNERAGLQSRLKIVASAAIYGSTVERSKHVGTNEISCNRRLVSAHISSVLTEYKQKQSCDFLSLSNNGDAGSTANGVKAPVQLHSPFFRAQAPFPLSHVPYFPAYPEKLLAPATQQVQPQLPHYAGNPFYGPQMNNTIGNSQQQHQQQQICQAHIARYRSPVGIAVLQNDQIHNSLSPSTQLQGFSSLSSKPKPQQQQHHHQLSLHGRRQHKDPHQFQLLYSTSRS
ncbi:uncharacterized protein LOC135584592 isoform X2 [Musa acuminata AAA Group]|uniref:uncharacterized protein LOC135584592 isoform X2 n=1 Tax=Musa acuminata AAA Group TaxID=214697 RepID=UPI0031DF7A0C